MSKQPLDTIFIHMGVKEEPLPQRHLCQALDHRRIDVFCREVKFADSFVDRASKPFFHIGLDSRVAVPALHVCLGSIGSEEGNDPTRGQAIQLQGPIVRSA